MDAEYRKLDSCRTGGGDVRGFPQHGPHAMAGANDFGTAWLSRHTLLYVGIFSGSDGVINNQAGCSTFLVMTEDKEP